MLWHSSTTIQIKLIGFKMKFASCLLFFFLIQIYHTKKISTLSRGSNLLSNMIGLKLRRIHPFNHKSLFEMNEIPENYGETNIAIGGVVGQRLEVTFDTQTQGLWVFSSKYHTCDPQFEIVKGTKKLWNENDSSSYDMVTPRRLVTVIERGEDWVFGYTGKDHVSILGHHYNHVWFTQVLKASLKLAKMTYDGVFGLQYDPKLGGFLSTICDVVQGSKMFSVHYPRIRMINSDFTDGVITLCGDDKTKYDASTMTYVPESDPGTWEVEITSISVNEPKGPTEITKSVIAKLDTTYNRIGVPASKIDKINQILKSYSVPDLEKEFECSKTRLLPSIIFTMNGFDYVLQGYDYVYEIQAGNSKTCRLLLLKRENPYAVMWTLGEPFFRKYYAKFDMINNRIGFAENKVTS